MRPTRAQLEAACGRRLRDVIAPRLDVLFCGINPGLYSGAVGHHFARPGNRFWLALYESGFTDVLLPPFEERALLDRGLGITNLVNHATAQADELASAQLRAGGRRLAAKARHWRPRCVAVLGIGAFRTAFDRPRAQIGPQPDDLAGASVWVLPNPSGRTAGYQLAALAGAFRELRRAMRLDSSA